MGRQTVIVDGSIDWTWIVVDDGPVPTPPMHVPCQYYRRPPVDQGARSLCRNLLTACAAIPATTTHVAIIEHDDWYAPTYLARALAQAAHPDARLIGDATQRYYHVGARRYRVYANKGASLCQTLFHIALLPAFVACIEQRDAQESYGIDGYFWSGQPPETWRLDPVHTVVGLKGLPGPPGLGVGHRASIIARWTPDPAGQQLHAWIGDDAHVYESCAGVRV